MLVPIEQIVEGERIRVDYGSKREWELFVASFMKYGQLQPLKVENNGDGKFKLLVGGRRLRAMKEIYDADEEVRDIPPGMVEVSFRDPVPLHTKLMMEHAENNDRKDFTFLERAKFIRKFHELMIATKGDVWTQEMTAHSLNLSPASISHYLRVEEAVKTNPGVAKAQSLDAAVKRMKVDERITKRKTEIPPAAIERAGGILHLGDAREWIKSIPDAEVDLVNFDPPWGDNTSYKSQENHEGFDDDTESAEELMRDLFPEIYRILKPDRFCIFWYRAWATEQMAAFAESFGFNLQFTRTPCIWYKVDKTADQNRMPEKQLIEAYETFYLLRKGDPLFHERFTNNVFPFERVKLGDIIHPTEKPVALNNALIKLCSIPGELVVDPTAGSASFLYEGLRLLRRASGCEKSKRYHERGVVRLASYLQNFSERKQN